jgi:DNA replication and repair protein RecF
MIQSISLADFRNYSSFTAEFSPRVNILRGKNAQGKTNLLEAVYLLSTARSFRGARDRDMIRFGADFTRVYAAATLEDGRAAELDMRLSRHGRRELNRNGVRQKRASDFAGTVTSVVFTPDDLNLVRGGAETRRRLLDACISQLRPRYMQALGEFNRLYQHKNRILRDYRENASLLAALEDFNRGLAEAGSVLIFYRASFVSRLARRAAEVHLECSGGAEELGLAYKTVRDADIENPDRRQLLEAYLARQAELYDAELSSGQCLVGAQRDDLELTIGGVLSRGFASQGQARTAALSVKLAERDIMREDTGAAPILLLDDVLSELDPARRAFVLGRIGGGQVFITCCEPIPGDALDGARVFTIDNGQLTIDN